MLLVAGLVAVVTWQVVAWQARDAVVVGADARPFICTRGSTVAASEGDDPADPGDRYTTALELTRGLNCDLRFVVSNTSALPVRVRSVQLPLLGPESGLPVHATALDGGFFIAAARPANDRLDARFIVPGAGLEIPAGDQVVLFARLRWKNDGCTAAGSTTSTDNSPAVTVSVLGIDGVRSPGLVSWAYRGEDEASCPSRG
ncbi:hypothetical protein GCM10025783_30570 [Amnibacterium soli]|uniref:DUF4232 domain-containing protein n=1 Tax=Amnibacterium soli TaxID=1282736 RepID=A0ABP8ZFS4_9MICO